MLREGQKKPAPYFDPSTPGFLGLVCAALHFGRHMLRTAEVSKCMWPSTHRAPTWTLSMAVTFDWVSWGNQLTRDIKEQTAQEVTNFGIL